MHLLPGCCAQEHLTKLLRTLQSNHLEPLLVFSFSKCVWWCLWRVALCGLHSFMC